MDLSGRDLAKLPQHLKDNYLKLEELNLSNNPLDHSMISDLVIRCRFALKKLDLSDCELIKLPKGLKHCRKLEELNLSNNAFTHSDLSTLGGWLRYELKKLNLSVCGLTRLPKNLGCCYKLEELNLSNNPLQIASIFFSLAWLDQLKKLDLSGCGLKEWPYGLQRCSNLLELNLCNNFIDHQDRLTKLKMHGLSSLPKSDKELLEPTHHGEGFTKIIQIIFEDAVYTQTKRG